MSKIKSTKRKRTTIPKLDPKLPSRKNETSLQDKSSEDSANNNLNQSLLASCSKSGSSKADTTTVGSCYESAVNVSANRDSSDAFSSYMKNAILEEVLNAKKAALLQSPAVMKLLREEQLKKQRKN